MRSERIKAKEIPGSGFEGLIYVDNDGKYQYRSLHSCRFTNKGTVKFRVYSGEEFECENERLVDVRRFKLICGE